MPRRSGSKHRVRVCALIGVGALLVGAAGASGAALGAGPAGAATPPTVTAISPAQGPLPGDTVVTVTGTGFGTTSGDTIISDVTSVQVGSTSLSATASKPVIAVLSATQLLVATPAATSPGTVDITVTTSAGTSPPSAADRFTYTSSATAPDCASDVSATDNLCLDAYDATLTISSSLSTSASLSFGDIGGSLLGSLAPSSGAVSLPAVQAELPQTSTTVDGITEYATLATDGPVTGTYDDSTGALSLGGTLDIGAYIPADGELCLLQQDFALTGTLAGPNQANSAFALTPNGPATENSACTSPTGASVSVSGTLLFTATLYSPSAAQPPTVTAVSPASCPAGGAGVTITGTNLSGATAVDFGSTVATSFNVETDTQIFATSPVGVGTVDVTVTTPSGTSATSPADQFTTCPVLQPPVVLGISPDTGPFAGGTGVTITGTGFTQVTRVDFGTSPASFQTVGSSQIFVTSPPGTGTVDVTVTTTSGTSATSAADQFTYANEGPFQVTGVSPDSGPQSGGTTVTITGTDLSDATAVEFGTSPAASFTVVSATEITATSPPVPSPTTVDVTIWTPSSATETSPADRFTYLALAHPPAVTAVSPAQGPVSGDTVVTVTGTGFGARAGDQLVPYALSVQVGSATPVNPVILAAPVVNVLSPTELLVVTPAVTSPGTVDITVTTSGGTSATSAADRFTYIPSTTPPSCASAVWATNNLCVYTDDGSGTGPFGVPLSGVGASFLGSVDPTSGTVSVPADQVALSQLSVSALGVTVDASPSADGPLTGTYDESTGAVSMGGTLDVGVYLPGSYSGTGLTEVVDVPCQVQGEVTLSGTLGAPTDTSTADVRQAAGSLVLTATQSGVAPDNSSCSSVASIAQGLSLSATLPVTLYLYTPPPNPPAVTFVFPDAGPTHGYSLVWVLGKNLTDVTRVTFGVDQARWLSFNSDLLLALSPAATSPGTVDVQVTTTGGGTSPATAADHYAYTGRSSPFGR